MPQQDVVGSHYVPIEEALSELDDFLDNCYTSTKNMVERPRYSRKDVTTISTKRLSLQTKASVNDSRNLLYVVNFDGDGCAVLSADDRTDDIVLAVSARGSLGERDFISADSLLNSTFEFDGQEDIAEFVHDLNELLLPALLLSDVIVSVNDSASSSDGITTKALSSETKYGPFTRTKWCQRAIDSVNVFNAYTPNNDPAGCVVIAVAQILVNTSRFTYQSNSGLFCDRDTMATVATYDSPKKVGTENARIQVGKFVHELGSKSSLCNVTYHKNGTTGKANGAKRALEAFLYSNVTKRTGFGKDNKNRATNQIRKGLPVYLGGCHKGTLSGHAWLLDGEWGDYYHINWGWNGAYDGYFAKGVFDPQNKRQDTDSQIDAVTKDYTTKDAIKAYTWTYRMVTYSL